MLILPNIRGRLRTLFKPMTGHDDAANAQRWRFYGWILIAVGMGFNANLFYSLGPTCTISLAIMLVGITLDLVKLNALLTMAVSWVRKETIIALGNLAFLLLLSLISLAAGFGFWSMTNERLETQRTQESLPFIAARDSYEAANKQVNMLSKYADINVNDEQAKLGTLKAEIEAFLSSTARNSGGIPAGTVRSRIGDCSGDGYYERAYCGKLQAMKERIIPIQQAITNGKAYHTALKARQQATQDLQASQGSRYVTAPIYMDLGKILGKPPEVARLILMSLITLVIELTAIWCFVNFNRFGYYSKTVGRKPIEIVDEPRKSTVPENKTQSEPVKWQVPHILPSFNYETSLQSSFARTKSTPLNNTVYHSQEEKIKISEPVSRQTPVPQRTEQRRKTETQQSSSYLRKFARFLVATK